MRILRVALVLFAVFPATGRAAEARIVSQDLPIGVVRSPAAAVAPVRFNLIGFHWQGSGRVVFRTRSQLGRWSAWRRAAPEAEDVPDARSDEALRRRGWRLGNPYWVGASDRIGYRLVGDVRRLRVWYVWSPVDASPARRLAIAGTPSIISRQAWNADEEILRGRPRYAKAVSFAVVHHTAGTSSYSRAASAAIVRGIELYHVRGNGWNDIGYNFLVDRYGQVFEGRAGGTDRNVIGAHAEGFNTGSVGVAVIGNYTTSRVTPAAFRALAKLLAWRLDISHVDPLSLVTWSSGGNPKFRRGAQVRLRAISGHRDTGFTSCPGTWLYARLPDLAHEVARIGLPKLYDPVARGSLGGPIRFTARLSAAAPWTVTVRDAGGQVVARGSGSGSTVSWTWTSAGAAPSSYTWTIEAGAQTRPASGTIGAAPPPPPAQLLSDLTLDPAVVSPDGDGIADLTTISYTLAVKSAVTATATDASGIVVATLFSGQQQSARRQSFEYRPDGLPDGAYVVTISAVAPDGRTAALTASLGVDRTLSGLSVTPAVLTPDSDGIDDAMTIGFTVATSVPATVQVEQAGTVIAVVFAGQLPAGASQFAWDGTAAGTPVPAGAYEVAVIVQGPFGETRHTVAFSIQR